MTSDLTDGIDSLSKKKKVESGRKIICREMEGILISLLPQEVVEIIGQILLFRLVDFLSIGAVRGVLRVGQSWVCGQLMAWLCFQAFQGFSFFEISYFQSHQLVGSLSDHPCIQALVIIIYFHFIRGEGKLYLDMKSSLIFFPRLCVIFRWFNEQEKNVI